MNIKTEIEWFKCDEKLPDCRDDEVLFISNNQIEIGTYSNQFGWTSRTTLDDDDPFHEVKYWAYLPELTEIE